MEQISKYFNAEKNESIFFIWVSIIAIIISVFLLLKIKQPFYNGIAYPLVAIAFIQLIVGTTVYMRSPKDLVRVNEIVHTNKIAIQTEEIPRMEVVMINFKYYRWVEITLLTMAFITYFCFRPMTMWKGVGLGLFIQAGLMLLLDFVAESRGKTYLEYLKTLI
jgi:hypothetical protein